MTNFVKKKCFYFYFFSFEHKKEKENTLKFTILQNLL